MASTNERVDTTAAKSGPLEDSVANGGGADERESNVNDLVLRDGFPALLMPGGQRPNVNNAEPLPRHMIWACDDALTFNERDMLIADCEAVFTARTRDDQATYSAGTTYFMPCQMKPRCALEALVLDIFHKHTAVMDPTTFSPQQSGAEWWTLVLENEATSEAATSPDEGDEEDEDEVGWHFDADYGLEAQAPNILLHPRLATVTYLTDHGAPTVILNVKSPAPSDADKTALAGSVDTAWLSSPKMGKHMAFDGRFLHGAPATFFPASTSVDSVAGAEPQAKKIKLNSSTIQDRKRVTLLVNVWLNHCPLNAEPLDDSVIDELKCKWPTHTNGASQSTTATNGIAHTEYFMWNEKIDLDQLPDIAKLSITNVCDKNPAGEEEVVLCGRLVTVTYGATMEDLHMAAAAASSANLVEVSLGSGVLSLHVGEECQADSDEDDGDENDDDDDAR